MNVMTGRRVVCVSMARGFVLMVRLVGGGGIAYGGTVGVEYTADGYSQRVTAQEQGGGYSLQIAIHRPETQERPEFGQLSSYSDGTRGSTPLFGPLVSWGGTEVRLLRQCRGRAVDGRMELLAFARSFDGDAFVPLFAYP